jgi:hypothetical protein
MSQQTRDLIKNAALIRKPVSVETRAKISANNNKSVPITAYLVNTDIVYRRFATISEAAIYFYNNVNKRKFLRIAINKNITVLGKYILKQS